MRRTAKDLAELKPCIAAAVAGRYFLGNVLAHFGPKRMDIF